MLQPRAGQMAWRVAAGTVQSAGRPAEANNLRFCAASDAEWQRLHVLFFEEV